MVVLADRTEDAAVPATRSPNGVSTNPVSETELLATRSYAANGAHPTK